MATQCLADENVHVTPDSFDHFVPFSMTTLVPDHRHGITLITELSSKHGGSATESRDAPDRNGHDEMAARTLVIRSAPMSTEPVALRGAEDAFRLSDEVVEAIAELRPVTATFWGVAGRDDAWDDLSPEGHERARARLAGFAARVPAAQAASTERWARLASDVLADVLRLELERYAHGDHLGDLNSIASSFQYVRMVFDVMDASTEQGWRARVTRLETLAQVLDGYRRSLELGLRTGHAVSARQVRAVIEQGRVHAGEQSHFRTLPAAMERAGVREPELQARLARAVPRACETYAAFAAWLEEAYLPSAPACDAVGRARYLREARRFLGMEIDPEETYAWGWREMATIAERMRALASDIAPGKGVLEVLELLKTDPSRCAASVEAFLELMRARQHEALEQLSGTHFDVPEEVRTLEVKLAPPGGPLGAYYAAPTDGFTRPGCVWYSLGDHRPIAVFDEIATAYHEGFPGHHLQVGVQVGLTEHLSRLHRLADGYSGYAEGWALYAEQLMAELGYYEKADYLLGMLSCQMIRACRVVIDIGSHLALKIPADQPFHAGEEWTFETGVEMLTTMAGMPLDHASSEMTRYLGWPGQAISYKVGQRVFLELRDSEQKRLGAAFDPKSFHARVLGCGNVGLDHLARLVLSES